MDSGLASLECIPQKTEDGYICTVPIDNFAATAKKCELGTSISTDSFTMEFPDSIGSSSWVVQIYPSGQYAADGYSNAHLSAYLRLISAENENKCLLVDIEFKVSVSNGFQSKKLHTKNLVKQCFDWSRKSTRWFGGKLVSLYDLRRFGEFSVQVQCHVKTKQTVEAKYTSSDIRYRNKTASIPMDIDRSVDLPEKNDAGPLKGTFNAENDQQKNTENNENEMETGATVILDQTIVFEKTIGQADDAVNDFDQQQPLPPEEAQSPNSYISVVSAAAYIPRRILQFVTGILYGILRKIFGE